MTQEQEAIIGLLLINKGGALTTSYGLCKGLGRLFGIVYCNKVIKYITDQQLIAANYINGNGHFTLTDKGMKLLDEQQVEIISFLKEHFPKDIDFISRL